MKKINVMRKMISIFVIITLLVGCSANDKNMNVSFVDVKGKVQLTHDNQVTKVNTKASIADSDRVQTSKESAALIGIDKKQYLYVEELTDFVLHLESTKPVFNIAKGSILLEIQEKLSKDVATVIQTKKAKISTRDSIMNVRLIKGKDGAVRVYVYVFDGSVKVKADKTLDVNEGYYVVVNDRTGKFECVEDSALIQNQINYANLPVETLKHLEDIKKYNERFDTVSLSDLRQWIEELSSEVNVNVDFNNPQANEDKPSENVEIMDVEKPTVHKPSNTPVVKPEGNKPSANKPTPKPEGNKPSTNKPMPKPEGDKPSTDEPTTKPDVKPETKPDVKPEDTDPSDQPIPSPDFDKWKDGHDKFVYDPAYAATGGHPDDGFFGEWGKWFRTKKAADAWVEQQRNDKNSEYYHDFIIVHTNVDGSARVIVAR